MKDVSKNLIKVYLNNKKAVKKQMQVKDLFHIIDSLKDLDIKDEEFLLDMKKILKSTLHKISTSQLTDILSAAKYMEKFKSC